MLLLMVIVVVPILVVFVGNMLRVGVLSALMVPPTAMLIAVVWAQFFELDGGVQGLGLLMCLVACGIYYALAHTSERIDVGWRRRQRANVLRAIREQKTKRYRMEVE